VKGAWINANPDDCAYFYEDSESAGEPEDHRHGGYDCLMMLMTRRGVTTEEENRIVA
jgi:hypothetical protein